MNSQRQPNRGAKARIPASRELLGLALNRDPRAPALHLQVRDGVRSALVSGTIAAGMRLPAEREMAAALGLNRTTVTRAYQELVADGLVEARGSAGTVVLPLPGPAGSEPEATGPGPDLPSWLLGLPTFGGSLGPEPTLLRDVAAASSQPGVVSLAAGALGPDLLPAAELAACLEEGVDLWGREAMGYSPVEGFGPLREVLAAGPGRDLVRPGDGVIVVSGATQGIDLAARTMVEPGDEVVVEVPTFVGILQTFALAGARLVGVPVDADGIRTDLLEGVLTRRRVRLVVVQPAFHNPTGAVLSPARRERLLDLARRFGVPVLEDDAYGQLCFAGPGPAPLKAADRSGSVVHVGTFSKSVMPGLRVGWVVAPRPLLDRMVLAKQLSDLNTSAIGQVMLARFLDSGRYDAHLRSVRALCRERCARLHAELGRVAAQLEVPDPPAGGLYLWCRLRSGPQAGLLSALAAREGVAVVGGEAFCAGSPRAGGDRVRLSFAGCRPETMAEAVRRLGAALDLLPAPGAHAASAFV